MKKNPDTELQDKALKIIKALREKGHTLEYIARSMSDSENEYGGVSLWSIQRWLTGKSKISRSLAQLVVAAHEK